MSASAKWFQDRGYTMTQDTWYDTTNMTEAAAVSRNLPLSLGSLATTWEDKRPSAPSGAFADTTHERWILNATDRFWNTRAQKAYCLRCYVERARRF